MLVRLACATVLLASTASTASTAPWAPIPPMAPMALTASVDPTPILDPALNPALSRPAEPQQSRKELRAELKEREAKTDAKDANALYVLVVWAERKGLASDARRIARKVLKADSDHEQARKMLGYVRHKDEWYKSSELERILAKEREAEAKAKGWVKHKGEWVDPKFLRYAKLGYVQRDRRWLRRADAERLDKGLVQHPDTGRWIKKADLEKAENGQYPVRGGTWVSVAEANQAHSNWQSPWVIVQEDFVFVSTRPLDECQKLLIEVSSALRSLKPIVWESRLPLPERFTIFVFHDKNDYMNHGTQSDDTGYSVYGAFYAPKHPNKPVAVNYAEQGWNAYYLRHAVGLGLSNVIFNRAGIESGSWFHTGIASYLERWQNRGHAQHFGKQYLAKGGVSNLRGFFGSFAVNAEMTTDDMNRNIYQAGIIFSYLFNGGQDAAPLRKAFEEILECVDEGDAKKGPRALKKFEKAAAQAEDAIKEHLSKLLAG